MKHLLVLPYHCIGTMTQQGENAVSAVLERIQRDIDGYDTSHDPQVLDHLLFQIDLLRRHIVVSGKDRSVLQLLSQAESAISMILDTPVLSFPQVNPASIYTNMRGRPRLDISEQQLLHLLTLKFGCPTIAVLLGVSLRTVRRRMSEYGLSVTALYSQISDADLDRAITALKVQYPNSGYRTMAGLLLQQGIRIQQVRIRESMHRVDPHGVTIKWQECIRRRQYNITQPLALWHIDGNHKLIR